MRGGFLIAADGDLYRRASSALVELGGATAMDDPEGEVVQYADGQGHLFTLYGRVPGGTEWEVREGPVTAADGVDLPDMQHVVACPFECRWPDLVARIAAATATRSDARTWLLDGDGVLWDARAVNAAQVRL